MSFFDRFRCVSGATKSIRSWYLWDNFASKTGSNKATLIRSWYLRRARLEISNGVRWRKTWATQLCGMSPSSVLTSSVKLLEFVKLDSDASIVATNFSNHLSLQTISMEVGEHLQPIVLAFVWIVGTDIEVMRGR
ncbi:hypothetical protein U1Q18_012346 [Sarracenia purpurea var. burkii]